MKPRIPSKPSGAFTLVELATLLGILAVLAATLLPTLSNARDGSASVVCAANQRQLSIASSMYGADNQQSLPPTEGWRNKAGSVVNLTAGGFWPAPTEAVTTNTPVTEALNRTRNSLTNAPLWPYAASAELYHCPADARFRLVPGRGWAFDSYSKVNGMNGLQGWSPSQRPFAKSTDVPDPSMSFVFLEESDPRGYNIGTWILNPPPSGWVDPLAIRHDTGSISSYLDGHQDYHRWTDSRTIEAARGSDQGIQNFSWTGGNATNPDYRWVWDRYRHKDWKPLSSNP